MNLKRILTAILLMLLPLYSIRASVVPADTLGGQNP